MRCEARTLDDIRALGANELADERKFEAAARVSEVNLSLYRANVQPFVRAVTTPQMAEAMRALHPMRLSYAIFGARNPFLGWVDGAADWVRENRRPAKSDNPMLGFQELASWQIVDGLDFWRKGMERLAEETFHALYGAPVLQAALGIDTDSSRPPRRAARSKLHQALVERRIGELNNEMNHGGLVEAAVRALIYVGYANGAVDERGFAAIRGIRDALAPANQRTLAEFKTLVRDQFLMLVIDEEAAVLAIPHLLPESIKQRCEAFDMLRQVLEAPGALGDEATVRLRRVATLFGLGSELATTSPARPGKRAAAQILSPVRAARIQERS
jgi:hypothetical protein